jgi:tRNA dimethylallyltransferase
MAAKSPLIVIVGETASGKSALAIELAQQFNGEIICADSRTVYRGMDIATAKPSKADRKKVAHHLLDIAQPDRPVTVAEFKKRTLQAIDDIVSRGKLPIMVGGSGLYIDAVLFDFEFRGEADDKLRAELTKLSVEELQHRLNMAGIPLPENVRNPRYLIRALETNGQIGTRKSLRPNTLIIGLQVDREVLRQRISERVDVMVETGFVDELERLVERYGWGIQALQAPGYKAFRGYMAGELSLEQAKQQFIKNDMALAKRQRTWFKRNSSIHWVKKQIESVDLVTTFLNK